MHVALVILGGLGLLAICSLFGWLWGASTAGVALGAQCFVPLWLVVAAVNMWVGVTHAGYSWREEAPIFALVFAVPAVVAAIVAWRLLRA